MKYNRAVILIMICIILVQCKVHNQKSTLKRLDIHGIQRKIGNYTKNLKEGFLKIHEGNSILNIQKYPANQSDIFYYEENVETGISTDISGNQMNGYRMEVFDKKNPIKNITIYYPSGAVRLIYSMYSERNLEKDARDIEYATGKAFVYDENGNLTKTILNTSDVFIFSFTELKAMLSGIDPDLVITKIRGSVDSGGSGIWSVNYTTPSLGICFMLLNAKSGKIIEDQHNITTIE